MATQIPNENSGKTSLVQRVAGLAKSYATWPLKVVPDQWVSHGDSLARAIGVGIYGPGWIGFLEGVVLDAAMYGASRLPGIPDAKGVEYVAVLAGLPLLRAGQGVYAALKARQDGQHWRAGKEGNEK